jgi:hypothetical protein
MMMNNPRIPPRRPLERRREWTFSILGVIVFGIVGYLVQGKLLSLPLVIALATFVVAVIQHYRYGR